MRYMVLIQNQEQEHDVRPADEGRELAAAFMRYTEELKKAGVFAGGDPLHGTARGVRIQVKNGERRVIDGPFSESKEVIGGYYLLQVKSREEAVEWAARCPGARYFGVELREVMEIPG